MYYWNRSNFEGLLAIAEALDAEAELGDLASYCRFRERGLRKRAFETLNSFLAQCETWDSGHAREACCFILETNARAPGTHQLLSEPLLARFIYPTLESWRQEAPNQSSPVRWLGLLRKDARLLEGALALDPSDVPVRRTLIGFHLASVDFATHHLGESKFLGEVAAAWQELEDARTLVKSAPADDSVADLTAEIEQHNSVLTDWEAYLESPTGSFPEWCRERGRNRNWPIAVYYGQ